MKLNTVVTIAGGGREGADTELRVKSLEELYAACRDAPPHRVMRVSIHGPEGVVLLNFGSLIKDSGKG